MTELEMAQRVWAGDYGSGDARKKALGNKYQSVQHLVEIGKDKINEILNTKSNAEKLVKLAATQLGQNGTMAWTMAAVKDEWCSEFIAYCAKVLGFLDAGLMPNAEICSKAHAFYRKKGVLFTKNQYTAKPGDIAYFGSDGTQHTAIVEKVDGNKITVIEGNAGNSDFRKSYVKRTVYNLNDLWGFACPLNDRKLDNKSTIRLAIEVLEGKYGSGETRKNNLGSRYAEVQTLIDKELKAMSVADAIIDLLAQEVLTGYWSSGDARKANLTKAGYDYSKVQARVNKLVEDSKPKEGWIKEDGKQYYYKNNKKLTGLQFIEQNWYYFDATGIMATGEVTIKVKFDSSGKLVG